MHFHVLDDPHDLEYVCGLVLDLRRPQSAGRESRADRIDRILPPGIIEQAMWDGPIRMPKRLSCKK